MMAEMLQKCVIFSMQLCMIHIKNEDHVRKLESGSMSKLKAMWNIKHLEHKLHAAIE